MLNKYIKSLDFNNNKTIMYDTTPIMAVKNILTINILLNDIKLEDSRIIKYIIIEAIKDFIKLMKIYLLSNLIFLFNVIYWTIAINIVEILVAIANPLIPSFLKKAKLKATFITKPIIEIIIGVFISVIA